MVAGVDGSLVRTNLLWEGLAVLLRRRPGQFAGSVVARLRGSAAPKAYVANRSTLDLGAVPLEPSVVTPIQATIAAGRPVLLASGAHESLVAGIGSRLGVTRTYGRDGLTKLTGLLEVR